MPTCGAYIALFVVACIRGYNYTVTVFFINKTDGFLSLLREMLYGCCMSVIIAACMHVMAPAQILLLLHKFIYCCINGIAATSLRVPLLRDLLRVRSTE